MLGRVVLVATDNVSTWRHVCPPLAGAGNRVIRVSNAQRAAGLLDSGAVDLILVEWGCGVDVESLLAASVGRIPVVGLLGGDRTSSFLELFCRREILNICSPRSDDKGNPVFDAGELVATCEKILRRDCFGLDKYMSGYGIELSHQVIVRAQERDQVIERLTAVVRALGGGRRMVDSVALVADELITNAVYNAPRGSDGTPRYARLSRRDKVTLEPTEYVRLDYGSDGRAFGIAVTDNFGGLSPDTIRAGLHRCLTADNQIEQKAGGAGLGIYTALGSVNQLVVNVEQGIRTEVIALWDLDRRGRGAGLGSLHVFASDETAARARRRATTGDLEPEAVPEATVSLSSSARREVCAALVDPEDRVSLAGVVRPTRTTAERRIETIVGQPPVDMSSTMIADAEEVGTDEIIEIEMTVDDHADGVPIPVPLPVRLPMSMEPAAQSEMRGPDAADITTLRGIQILRRSDRPGMVATLDRIREATHLADGLEAALTWLLNRWEAAVLLCRVGSSLVPWTGAGDLDSWEAVCETAVPLGLDMIETGSFTTMPEKDSLNQDTGWLGACAAQPGIGVGLSVADSVARRLSALLIGTRDRGDALAISLGVGVDVVLVMFACRSQTTGLEDAAAYDPLHAELTQLLMRVEQASEAVPMVPMSWAVGG